MDSSDEEDFTAELEAHKARIAAAAIKHQITLTTEKEKTEISMFDDPVAEVEEGKPEPPKEEEVITPTLEPELV